MKIPLSDYRAMNKINQIAENVQAARADIPDCLPGAPTFEQLLDAQSQIMDALESKCDTPIVEIEYRDGTCETLTPAPTISKNPKPRRKRK